VAPGRAVAEPAVPGVPAPEPDAGVPELVVQGPAPAAREPAEPALAGPEPALALVGPAGQVPAARALV